MPIPSSEMQEDEFPYSIEHIWSFWFVLPLGVSTYP
jgi:hypothetical protein